MEKIWKENRFICKDVVKMKMVSDFLKILVNAISICDSPINILINDSLYDIEDFYYDNNIEEYVMKLSQGYSVAENKTEYEYPDAERSVLSALQSIIDSVECGKWGISQCSIDKANNIDKLAKIIYSSDYSIKLRLVPKNKK